MRQRFNLDPDEVSKDQRNPSRKRGYAAIMDEFIEPVKALKCTSSNVIILSYLQANLSVDQVSASSGQESDAMDVSASFMHLSLQPAENMELADEPRDQALPSNSDDLVNFFPPEENAGEISDADSVCNASEGSDVGEWYDEQESLKQLLNEEEFNQYLETEQQQRQINRLRG